MSDLPLVIHQSDMQSFNYCPARMRYEWEMERTGQFRNNSRLAYGTVLHNAMHTLERHGELQRAIDSFLYYWHPHNIEALCPRVPADGWFGRDSYGSMRKRGVDVLRKYHDLMRYDDHELLALEFEFVVPLRGTGIHLAGTIDRLAVRWYRQIETLCIDDYKTGKQKWNLRWNVQGSAYAYASHQPEFWDGMELNARRLDGREVTYKTEGFSGQQALTSGHAHRGAELQQRFEKAGRRFTWIDLHDVKIVDGGWRGPQDYERLKAAAMEIRDAVAKDVFPFRLDGEVCRFCSARKICGGHGLPDPEHGDPAMRYFMDLD